MSAQKSSPRLRYGVIGCGVIAPAHVASFKLLENVELAWACDLVEEKARALAAKYGIANVTTDYRQVLADPALDCISVCTDHASHTPISIAALEAGKHVLCEKALSASREGLDAMMAAHARTPQLVFSGVFQHRFDKTVQFIKQLVDERRLGTMLTAGATIRCHRSGQYYAADKWRGTWAQEGGAVLINQSIHFIDAVAWIMGGVEAVSGAYANLTHQDVMETEDTAVAALRFKSGSLGTIEGTCSTHLGWEPTIFFHGTQGSIELRGDKAVKVCFTDEAAAKQIADQLEVCREAKRLEAVRTHYGTSHPLQIADFASAVRERRSPFVSAESARHAVDIVLSIYRASRDSGWVKVG